MYTQSLMAYKQLLFSLVEKQGDRYVMNTLTSHEQLSRECRKFIESEIEWWAYTALIRKNPGHRFPVDKSLVLEMSNDLCAYFTSIAECDTNELRDLLGMFADTYFNSLCRPVYTLTSFVFRNEAHKSAHEILLRSNGLSLPLLNIPDIMKSMLMEHQHPTSIMISKDQFHLACSDALRSSVGRMSASHIAEVFSPLFTFLVEIGEEQSIPSELLHAFFLEAGHTRIAEALYASKETLSYSKEELLTLLSLCIGNDAGKQIPQQDIIPKDIPSRKYFGAKGIMLITGERLSLAKRKILLEREIQLERESQISQQQSKEEIDQLLRDYHIQEQPLKLIKQTFLGALPMQVQVHYANAMFDGDLSYIRKLGASIDKTVGVEAALATCKAFIYQFGQPIREAEDPIEGLCDLIEVFCKNRDN